MSEICRNAVTIFMIPQMPDINSDTEPPVTQHLTDQELRTLLPQSLDLNLPFSTVAVKCAVIEQRHPLDSVPNALSRLG